MDDITRVLDDAKHDIRAHIFLTGESETHNLSVSDLQMGSDIPAVGVLQPFDVEVTNWGRDAQDSVRVTLCVDADPPSAQALIEHIPAGESRSITLSVKVRDDGYHTITAAVPPDHLPADDRRTIALKGIAKLNVLLIDGNPGLEPRESEVFFLRHAMIPVPRARRMITSSNARPFSPLNSPTRSSMGSRWSRWRMSPTSTKRCWPRSPLSSVRVAGC